MKIATWNLEGVTPGSWKRGPIIRSALSERGIDVLVLTESHPGFSPDTRLRLLSASSAAPDQTGGRRWVCIWARSDWAFRRVEPRGDSERYAAALLSPPERDPVIVFGSVLPWRSDTRHEVLRGGAAFGSALAVQSEALSAVRDVHRDARVIFAGDWNQEYACAGPTGTSVGRDALDAFLKDQQLTVVTGGERDPLMRSEREWMRSIDHIALDLKSAKAASAASVWPGQFPLHADWPDHYGVEVSVSEA